jgi:hypothetical protein
MRRHDRGIDRHRPIDPASSVGLGLDRWQQHVPGPVRSETLMPLPHRLPRAERSGRSRQPPRCDNGNDPLDHLQMIMPTDEAAPACGVNGSIRAHAASLSSAERVTHPVGDQQLLAQALPKDIRPAIGGCRGVCWVSIYFSGGSSDHSVVRLRTITRWLCRMG